MFWSYFCYSLFYVYQRWRSLKIFVKLLCALSVECRESLRAQEFKYYLCIAQWLKLNHSNNISKFPNIKKGKTKISPSVTVNFIYLFWWIVAFSRFLNNHLFVIWFFHLLVIWFYHLLYKCTLSYPLHLIRLNPLQCYLVWANWSKSTMFALNHKFKNLKIRCILKFGLNHDFGLFE